MIYLQVINEWFIMSSVNMYHDQHPADHHFVKKLYLHFHCLTRPPEHNVTNCVKNRTGKYK